MNKSKTYRDTWFSDQIVKDAIHALERISEGDLDYRDMTIEHNDGSTWGHDEPSEFYADYRIHKVYFWLSVACGETKVRLSAQNGNTNVTVLAKTRADIEEIFSVFDVCHDDFRIPSEENKNIQPMIFIGHGRSNQWRNLKDHLQDKHGYQVEAYETGSRIGHTIRDILEDMVKKSTFAILVLTAEDSQESGEVRARQNVIHEAGLFQGKLGFARAIMLLEQGVEEFSNVQGVQYLRFSNENIKEVFGDVIATLRREFD